MGAAEALAREHGLIQPQRITEGITNRQMSKVLKDAAAEAEKLMYRNMTKLGTISGQVRQAQLAAAIAGLGAISTELWTQTGKITRAGMYQAAQLAADQAMDLDFFLGMPGKALIQYAQSMHFEASHAVESLISRRTNGIALADRIYANGRLGVRQAAKHVERGLALQLSAREIAKTVRSSFDPAVPGGVSYAAMRLARTEINNAHHETSKRMAETRPWVRAMKWNLSRSHPRPDICNDYAETDHENLGRGVYTKGNAPSKPHPQCLCYLTHVQIDDDEFVNNLVNGQYDNWLSDRGVRC